MNKPDAANLLQRNADTARAVFAELVHLAAPLQTAAEHVATALLSGHKLLACGNGGSACDAAHLTAEIAGRYLIERPGYPAIDLTADHSILTALINDYPPEEVFARQVRAQGSRGDVLAAFTTSGNSRNVLLAIEAARDIGVTTVAFLGKGGGAAKGVADVDLIVPSDVTARVQECHLLLYHTLCESLDPLLAEAKRGGQG